MYHSLHSKRKRHANESRLELYIYRLIVCLILFTNIVLIITKIVSNTDVNLRVESPIIDVNFIGMPNLNP